MLLLYATEPFPAVAQDAFQPGETAAWRQAQDQATADAYALYLERFPGGVMVRTAFRNLVALDEGLPSAGPDEAVGRRVTGSTEADAQSLDRY